MYLFILITKYLVTFFETSKQIVGIIESYLLTSYSTEAWVVLNFVKSAKVKSVEPDALINHFISYNSVR